MLAALVGMGAIRSARADPLPDAHDAGRPQPAPHWDAAWSHSNAWDYSIAGMSATALAVEAFVLQPIQPTLRWAGPILFDTAVRDALRMPNANDRQTIENVAWVLWGAQLAVPVFIDLPYAWARYGFGLARDLFWQDAATLLLAAAVDLGLRDLIGRARQRVDDCLASGGTNCLDGVEATRSFPGGHILNSTAASVLTCTQHLYVHLYGGPWDGLTCAMTLASNATLAVLRIVSDNHWATDEIAGMALGALIGWGVPYLFHFHGHAKSSGAPLPSVLAVPVPVALDHGGGLGVTGIF